MDAKKIARINALAAKARAEGLTEAELAERDALRKEYVAAVRKCSGPAASRKGDAELQRLRPLRSGVRKGEMKGRDFVPDPDWALSLSLERGEWPEYEVDGTTALRFLHRDALVLPEAPAGYVLLTYAGLPLGFVKNLGPRCNNLHPQRRRIVMDINSKK